MQRKLRPKRSRAMMESTNDDSSSTSSFTETIHIEKTNIQDDVQDELAPVRNYWLQRPNKIFMYNDTYITSFSTKRCVFNPDTIPHGYDNWFYDNVGKLCIYPTNQGRADIVKCFKNNLRDNVPVRVCLQQDTVMYDFGWMMPEQITPNNIMTLKVYHNINMVTTIPDEPKTNPSIVAYDSTTDHTFNSLRELGWQRFLSELNVPHKLESDVPVFQTDLGPYRPDMILYPDSQKLCTILEIKPAYPYCDQELRMRNVVEQTKKTGFILYGKPKLPFDNNVQYRDKIPKYNHANGARAIKFYWDSRINSVRRAEGYVWTANDSVKPYLRKYQPFITSKDSIGKYDWKHPSIVDAYARAQESIDSYKPLNIKANGHQYDSSDQDKS
jgi:hypothetical protein